MINLRWLNLDDNQIQDIEPLRGLSNLRNLGICDNKITNISAVEDLKELRILQFWNNEVNDISPVAALENLEELAFINNDIEDISALANLYNLKSLDMEYNPLNNEAYEEIIPIIMANNPGIRISYISKNGNENEKTTIPPEIRHKIIRSRVVFPLVLLLVICFAGMFLSNKYLSR